MKIKKFTIIILFIMLIILNLPQTAVYAWNIFPPKEAEVPIIMYHLITNNTKYQGKFGISPAEMEEDLKYLKENGYETVLMSDLIDFVNHKRSLPKKPIILTFDDGCSSDYYYLFPLLKKYKMNAVLSIIGKVADDYSDDANTAKKPHLMWEQIEQMYKNDVIEIQNHSYNLHGGNGAGKLKRESFEAYQQRLKDDLSKNQKQIKDKTGFTPTTFAYPLGVISKGSKEALQDMGFKVSLSCAEGMNVIRQGDTECLFNLKRNIRRSGRPVSEILERIEK